MTNDATKLPPQNLEAEQSVLGGILIDNQAFHKVVDLLRPEDFYRPAHAKIYQAICALASQASPIDVVTLTTKLKELQFLEEIGGASYLAELLERVPTAVHVEYHAKLVGEQAVKRRLVSLCSTIGSRGYDPAETTEETFGLCRKEIFSLTSSRQSRGMAPVRDIVRSAFLDLEARFENQGKLTGVPSGYDDLDKLTGGFQKSDLIIVACRPSVGKTSFSLGSYTLCRGTSKSTGRLLLTGDGARTNCDSSSRRGSQSRLPTDSFRNLTEQDWARLTRAAGVLSEAPIFIDDTPSLTVLETRGKARRLKAEIGNIGHHRGRLLADHGNEQDRAKP